MGKANSSFWYLELSQSLLCFSGDQVCRNTPRAALSQWLQPEHLVWSILPRGDCRNTTTAQASFHASTCFAPNSILKRQTQLSPLCPRKCRTAQSVPAAGEGGQTLTPHTCLRTLMSCTSRMRNTKMNICAPSSCCVTFTTQGKIINPQLCGFSPCARSNLENLCSPSLA